MKNINGVKTIFFVLLVIISPLISNAQYNETKNILERQWNGVSEQNFDLTKSGKAYLKQELNLKLAANYNVTGTWTSYIILDGKTYKSKSRVKGKFNGSTYELTLKEDGNIYNDALPYGLKWCPGLAKLTLYKNKNKSGHYILSGTTDGGSCSGISKVELVDN